MDSKRILALIAIYSTGSSTYSRAIIKDFKDQERLFSIDHLYDMEEYREKSLISNAARIPENQRFSIKCLSGHIYFGTVKKLVEEGTFGPDRKLEAITMLRDPVERVLSEYYYYKSGCGILADEVKDMDSVEDYIKSDYYMDNLHLRYIIGTWLGRKKKLGEDDYRMALDYFRDYFTVVGINEYFEESMFLIGLKTGISNIYYQNFWVNKNRPTKYDIPKSSLELILETNQLDIRMYEAVKSEFESTVSSWDNRDRELFKEYKLKLKLYQEQYRDIGLEGIKGVR